MIASDSYDYEEIGISIRRAVRPARVVFAVLGLALLAILLSRSLFQVGLGEVAVVVDPVTKTVSRPIVGPTLAFKPPWAYIVKDYVGVEAIDMFFEPPRDYPAVFALTKDGVSVDVDITIRYRVRPEYFDLLVRNYPALNYEEDFLVATARQVVREVVAKYVLTDLIENRALVARDVESSIEERIRADPVIGRALKLLGVNMRNVRIPDEILKAINEKIAAQQYAIKAEYERKAKLIAANATAEALLIEAEGRAKALLILAEAQAKSISLLANMTGVPPTKVVEYYFYLEAVKEAAASGKSVLVIGQGGVTPLITPGD